MVSLSMHGWHTRATKWLARGTAVALLAAGTVGYSAQHKTVTIDDHGRVSQVSTFGATVADALDARGVTVAAGDIVSPALGERIHNGDDIAVRTPSQDGLDVVSRTDVASRSAAAGRTDLAASTVTVSVDGKAEPISTTAVDVRGALQDAGVVLDADDVVSVDLDAALTAGQTITVTRAQTAAVTVTEVLKYQTTKKNDSSIEKGTKVVKTKGSNGKSVTTYSVTTVGGKEVARTAVASSVVTEAVDQVVLIGTGEVAAKDSDSGGSADSSDEDSSGPSAPAVKPGTARALGKELAADRGWGDKQFGCLEALWTRESGWSTTAGNKSSGAYGIPQALPGSKMASAGPNWRTDAETQIKWGLGYIAGRYGTPCGAWSHFQSHNWY